MTSALSSRLWTLSGDWRETNRGAGSPFACNAKAKGGNESSSAGLRVRTWEPRPSRGACTRHARRVGHLARARRPCRRRGATSSGPGARTATRGPHGATWRAPRPRARLRWPPRVPRCALARATGPLLSGLARGLHCTALIDTFLFGSAATEVLRNYTADRTSGKKHLYRGLRCVRT